MCRKLLSPASLLLVVNLAVFRLLAGSAVAANLPVTISLGLQKDGAEVSPDFMGLSFEVSQLMPREDGSHYFSLQNKPLLQLFRTLGIRNLRIGGNTSDRDARQLPAESDLDSLFGFAGAANVKIIYCLRLKDGDPQSDAHIVKYILDRYGPMLEAFSIGQEPSAYAKSNGYSYEMFRADWKKFADVIAAAASEVKFCGPSVHNNATWTRRFLADFGHSNHVALATAHLYPGGAGGKVPTPEIGRDRMLSNSFTLVYQKLRDGSLPACEASGVPFRLEEVNNYFNGGAENVSSTFAAALWGLDFSYWWAAHGAAGVNFHTGDKVAAGSNLHPSKYTAYFTAADGYLIRPLGYGLKAFDLGCHGRLLPVSISNPHDLNLSAYGVLGDDKNIYVTIINKEHGATARSAEATLALPAGLAHGDVIYLSAPDHDVAATSGVTLGGAEIKNDANWNGQWTNLALPEGTGSANIVVSMPTASAAIVRLVLKP